MPQGPMSEDPKFRTVSMPDTYQWETDSPVRYVPAMSGQRLLGYLWASVTDDATAFVPAKSAGMAGDNAGVAWIRRLRWAKANGISPLEALRRWAGQPEDPKCGQVPPDSEQEAASLADLRAQGIAS